MKVLITGAKGQLGSEIASICDDLATANTYIFTDVEDLNICSAEALQQAVVDARVDVVVNCAAYTAVDKAEDDEAMARKINRDASEYLALACKAVGATLFHVSTDYVFDGTATFPLQESDETNPIGVYGRTKREGEQAIQQSGVSALIFRTAWLYSQYGANFVRTMLRLTGTMENLKVVADQRGTPTYAADLARVIVCIIESENFKGHEGIYHFTNEGECTWYDFACEIAAIAGHTNCNITPCTSDEFPSKVRRPSYSVLNKNKMKQTFGVEIREWQEALRECMEKLKQ